MASAQRYYSYLTWKRGYLAWRSSHHNVVYYISSERGTSKWKEWRYISRQRYQSDLSWSYYDHAVFGIALRCSTWWWWTSDIQRYHPRIYCSVKPGRQLGYKLVLCTARTATVPLIPVHKLYICMYVMYMYVYVRTYKVHVCIYIHTRSVGPPTWVYESRMFMLLAAARQKIANIGSQFNDRPIVCNLPLAHLHCESVHALMLPYFIGKIFSQSIGKIH